jgi:hypothetical protein
MHPSLDYAKKKYRELHARKGGWVQEAGTLLPTRMRCYGVILNLPHSRPQTSATSPDKIDLESLN